MINRDFGDFRGFGGLGDADKVVEERFDRYSERGEGVIRYAGGEGVRRGVVDEQGIKEVAEGVGVAWRETVQIQWVVGSGGSAGAAWRVGDCGRGVTVAGVRDCSVVSASRR